jgi:hypothetical protein
MAFVSRVETRAKLDVLRQGADGKAPYGTEG